MGYTTQQGLQAITLHYAKISCLPDCYKIQLLNEYMKWEQAGASDSEDSMKQFNRELHNCEKCFTIRSYTVDPHAINYRAPPMDPNNFEEHVRRIVAES